MDEEFTTDIDTSVDVPEVEVDTPDLLEDDFSEPVSDVVEDAPSDSLFDNEETIEPIDEISEDVLYDTPIEYDDSIESLDSLPEDDIEVLDVEPENEETPLDVDATNDDGLKESDDIEILDIDEDDNGDLPEETNDNIPNTIEEDISGDFDGNQTENEQNDELSVLEEDVLGDNPVTDEDEIPNEASSDAAEEALIENNGTEDIVDNYFFENENAEGYDELSDGSHEPVEECNNEESEYSDDDPPKTLTREITPEVIESRNRDTEATLDNYRENLRDYGVDEEQIESFVNQEREKINAEYESLDNGDTSSNVYHQPTDWEEVANSLINEGTSSNDTFNIDEREDFSIEEPTNFGEAFNVEEQGDLSVEENIIPQNDATNESVDYDAISNELERDALSEGFKDINIDQDVERLNNSLDNFDGANWENLSLNEQKESMEGLADYVSDVLSLENPPTIEYYNNPVDGDYGGYNPSTNTLQINEHMLYDSDEAADTIAHELWHAHQHECASNPQNALHHQYQYGFENYISPDLDPVGYQNQLVEAEARAFAEQFKDRLNALKGGYR